MIQINCSFFLAAQLQSIRPDHTYKLTKSEMGIYGEIYTGNLIRSLGRHYDDYVSSTEVSIWRIYNSYHSATVGRVKMHSEKHKSQSVTGNIGEAVVMPALSSAMKAPRLSFQRMKAHKLKCPDFRFHCNWSDIDDLWKTNLIISGRKLPEDMPLEVKTHLSKDEGYPLDALEQLLSYWIECDQNGRDNSVGFGVIARVNLDALKNPGSYNHFVRYVLFIPKSDFILKRFKRGLKIAVEFKKKYKEIEKNKEDQESYDARLARWLGRYFL